MNKERCKYCQCLRGHEPLCPGKLTAERDAARAEIAALRDMLLHGSPTWGFGVHGITGVAYATRELAEAALDAALKGGGA